MVNLLKNFFNKVIYSKSHSGILARGAIGVFTIKLAGVGVLFGLHVMLARLLGAQQYGIYVYVWTWMNILVVLCLLGFQTSLVRFIAEYNIKKQWALLRGILKKSSQVVLTFSIFVSFLGVVVIWFLGDKVSFALRYTFYIGFCTLPVFAFARLRAASLRALKQVVQSELLLRVMRPVLVGIVVIVFFFWLGDKLDSRCAMAANFVAIVVVIVVGTIFLHRLLPKLVSKIHPVFINKQWLIVSFPLLLVAAMRIILKRTDIVMLGVLKSSEQAGIYSAASRISDLAIFALSAIDIILAPMISELYHTGQKKELQKIVTLAARATFTFTLVMSLILIIFGKSVLSLFGTAFVVAYIPLLILLSSQIVNSLVGSVGYIMSMSGRQNALGIIIGISAAVNILLNIILIPILGLIGAAISTAVSMVMWNVTMLIYVYNKLGINSTVVAKD